ncbi:hypothetical protein [Halodesulfurarchaeum sp.]|uniref:hypothetical protein n=1 Tax=Halodesulfurarchaeum sp. TaxID=1980530 RepID=UPI001BC19B5C|nr:hypothetical protein [Halodesulfurarchaeum sp.]
MLAFVRVIYFGNLLGNTFDALKFAADCRTGRSCGQLIRGDVSARDILNSLRNTCPI